MPSMSDITVKKADGTTDVVYTALTPSSGDKSPAVWSNNSSGDAIAFRPQLSATARWNTQRTGRRVDISFSYPQTSTNTTTGVTTVVNSEPISCTLLLPASMPSDDSDEAAAQFAHLLGSSLILAVLKSGFAPT